MRSLILLILAVANTAYADDPFACVDSDVADAFLGDPYRGRGEYSSAIPEGFVDLNLPVESSFVGSQTIDSMTTVIFKTNVERDRALSAAVDAMTQSGWTEYERQRRSVSGGFQISTHRVSATVLCNDNFPDALSIVASEKSGQTFVSYVQHAASQSCDAKPPTEFRRDPSEMMRLVPRLKLPEGTKAANTGMGGNGHQVNSYVDVSSAVSRSDLSNFLENQIRDQDWEFQTSWSSHHSSGSVWALDTVDDGLLIGTLHLLESGVGPIRVRFSVNLADPSNGRNHGSWSESSN
ncbi:MAG: hypothetical protein AAAFM81_14260 [Pseudomonadota bacterium]